MLDTCVLLDLSIAPERISESTLAWLLGSETTLIVSAAVAWEVAIKTKAGKLIGGDRLLAAWDQQLQELAAVQMGIDHRDALHAGGLGWGHLDPFDRMIVAQALRRNLPVATRDRAIVGAAICATVDTARG